MTQLKLGKRENVAALCAVKQKDGTSYIFYYHNDYKIAYLSGAQVSDYCERTVKVRDDGSGAFVPVRGSNSALAATTWNDEIRLYYIDIEGYLKELCLNKGDGRWYHGALSELRFRAAPNSGLHASGNDGCEMDEGQIAILYMDAESEGGGGACLAQLSINTRTREWEKEVVSQ